MARVKAQYRHLCEPLHDRFALLLRDAVNVGKTELVYHVRYDRCMATLKGLVEKMDQLCWVPRDDVLRLRVQGVRNGNRDGDMLALVEEVTGRTLSLTGVLVRLEVVDNRVRIRFRLPIWAAGRPSSSLGDTHPLERQECYARLHARTARDECECHAVLLPTQAT